MFEVFLHQPPHKWIVQESNPNVNLTKKLKYLLTGPWIIFIQPFVYIPI